MYKRQLTDVSGQDWDLIICGTFQMQEKIEEVAPKFPDKKYIVFEMCIRDRSSEIRHEGEEARREQRYYCSG